MGKRFHSYKKNKLVSSKVKTHAQRMHYEAIIQVAQIQDEDLLYLNFSNAAMGTGLRPPPSHPSTLTSTHLLPLFPQYCIVVLIRFLCGTL